MLTHYNKYVTDIINMYPEITAVYEVLQPPQTSNHDTRYTWNPSHKVVTIPNLTTIAKLTDLAELNVRIRNLKGDDVKNTAVGYALRFDQFKDNDDYHNRLRDKVLTNIKEISASWWKQSDLSWTLSE